MTGRSVKGADAPDDYFLLLDPADNILICVRSVARGTQIRIEGAEIMLCEDIAVGHKIARQALFSGDKVYRYGFPIGTMRDAAARGCHVHHHNLQSDYIPAHGRDASSARSGPAVPSPVTPSADGYDR
jgi:hypothetical protein